MRLNQKLLLLHLPRAPCARTSCVVGKTVTIFSFLLWVPHRVAHLVLLQTQRVATVYTAYDSPLCNPCAVLGSTACCVLQSSPAIHAI